MDNVYSSGIEKTLNGDVIQLVSDIKSLMYEFKANCSKPRKF